MPPRKSSGGGWFRATESFVYDHGSVSKDTLVREDDELLRNFAYKFEPVADHATPDVEQATAGPGERRGDRN